MLIDVSQREDEVATIILPGDSLLDYARAFADLGIVFRDEILLYIPPEVLSLLGEQATGRDVTITVREIQANLPEGDRMLEVGISINGVILTYLEYPIFVHVAFYGQNPFSVWHVDDYGQMTLLPTLFGEWDSEVLFETSYLGRFIVGHDPSLVASPIVAPPPEPIPAPPVVTETLMRFVIGNINFTTNGVPQQADYTPFIASNRTMIPLVVVTDAMNTRSDWINETRTVVITAPNGNTIHLPIGTPLYDSSGAYMGTPVIRNNRTFVPLRFVAEALGAEVDWDSSNQAAYVIFSTNR